MEGLENLQPNSDYAKEAGDAMNLFRSALAGLIPVFQKTEIKWNMLNDNDEFYSLSEALYKMIVVSKFESIARAKHLDIKDFANYGFHHKSLKDMNYIEVSSPDYPNSILTFNYIACKDKPIDVLYCHRLDAQGNVLDRDLEVSFETAEFNFRFR